MAIEDSLARLQSVVDEVVAEVKQTVSDLVEQPEAPTTAEAAPEAATSTNPVTVEVTSTAASEGVNVQQQDVVASAPTTEPPADTDEASESTEEAPADAAG